MGTFVKKMVFMCFIFASLAPHVLYNAEIHLLFSESEFDVLADAIVLENGKYSIVKMREGNPAWKVVEWDNNPITPEEEVTFNCDFVDFTSAESGKSAKMCVHSFTDIVSDSIRDNKRWKDCDVLPNLWKESLPPGNSTSMSSPAVYVDIGSNIGSCVMEMLLGTDASIIAFEPHPMNIFNIKKTVSQLDKSYQDRLTLIPIGLGDVKATSTIYSASNNMGNSVIGRVIKDTEGQQFDEKLQFTIHVERLDSVLSNHGSKVRLMKMDVQGFECKTVEGMGQDLANKVDQIKFEYAKHWLSSHNCNDLLPKLRNYGFEIFQQDGQKVDGNPARNEMELIASKPKIVSEPV
jgi:FkbM family methyltransferase